MRKVGLIFVLAFLITGICGAQTKPRPRSAPAGVPVRLTGVEALGGSVEGRIYRNQRFSFEIVLPDNWFIAGPDFERIVKKKGFDLSLNSSEFSSPNSRSNVPIPVRNLDILMTAFRSEPESKDSAILRVTAENLKLNPHIKDAVDYFDAITAAFMSAKLPPDFKYSATKAEQLGAMQFGYLDTSSNAGKKRMYATVRNGFAIMFTLSYTNDEDLQAVRRILEAGSFALNRL